MVVFTNANVQAAPWHLIGQNAQMTGDLSHAARHTSLPRTLIMSHILLKMLKFCKTFPDKPRLICKTGFISINCIVFRSISKCIINQLAIMKTRALFAFTYYLN